jgi:ferredoxin
VGLIPKIVSTPLKWVSRKFIHGTLLRFPGGDPQSPVACVYCPEMCRFSCPVAVVSGNDAVTPCNKMGLLYKEEKWPDRSGGGGPLWPVFDCTGCGRCTEYCVYIMPVGERLFASRSKHTFAWDPAMRIAAGLTGVDDPVGDLADELGDVAKGMKRLARFAALDAVMRVVEPRSLYFAQKNGVNASLAWAGALIHDLGEALRVRLGAKMWLFHESVWFSRKLGRADEMDAWVARAREAGVRIVRPHHCGRDCIDCGGEGAYHRLFPEQAARMAREFWQRDRHRADGVLCVSARCASHLRSALGGGVEVLSLAEIL